MDCLLCSNTRSSWKTGAAHHLANEYKSLIIGCWSESWVIMKPVNVHASLRQCKQALVIHQHHAKKQLALLHIVFTAGSWPMVYHTATLIALCLGLLFLSVGAKITTSIIIYTSCYFGGSLCMRRRNTLIFILLLSFFCFFTTCWGTGGDLALLHPMGVCQ